MLMVRSRKELKNVFKLLEEKMNDNRKYKIEKVKQFEYLGVI